MGVQIGRIAALIVVTAAAVAVMWASGAGWDPTAPDAVDDSAPALDELPPSPVSVQHLQIKTLPITDSYSGMLHPWERFQVGFDIGGRIAALGDGPDGKPLDDGAPVSAEQVLATLDQRAFFARKREAEAMKRRAEDEWNRAQELRQVNPRAISEPVLLTRETEFEIASAQLEMAEKALDDATLRSPVDGVIAKRQVNKGQAVLPQQTAFEIVQDSTLLLKVGVPESRIRAFLARRREVEAAGGDSKFNVKVELVGGDALGHAWTPLDGAVHQISQTADEASGMFQVEVAISNEDRTLRAGQIGVGHFAIAEVEGFRIPATTAVIRNNELVLFYAEAEDTRGKAPLPAQDEVLTARMHVLRKGRYLEQDDDLVLLDLPLAARNVIVRGQHRLVDGAKIIVAQAIAGPTDEVNGAAGPAKNETKAPRPKHDEPLAETPGSTPSADAVTP